LVTYEVKEVALLPERGDHLRGAELDSPLPGSRGNIYVLHIIGWVVGRDVDALAVEVLCDGMLIRVAPVRGRRPDVVEAIGDIPADTDSNFHALIGLVGLACDAELQLRVVLADGSRVPMGKISVSRTRIETGYTPRMRPLMVTCLGRTGSTWLMSLLTAHPEVVVFRRFPYESAPAKYWLHMLRVLSEPANLVQSARPDDFDDDPFWVGKNPFWDESLFEQPSLADWTARTYVERLARFCQSTVDDWYLTLANSQRQSAPVYFAEKHMAPKFLPTLIWELYPDAREVFLVRDFRDVASSILAFDERRGFPGFGRPEGITDEEYVRGGLRQMALDFRRSWQARLDRAHLLRYEDLVSRPRETLGPLLQYLGLDASPATIDRTLEVAAQPVLELIGTSIDASMVARHRTSSDLEASIGRWKRDDREGLADLYNEAFSDLLVDFGYSAAGYARGAQ
jgi:hypothetical protein